jgi:hypothetical protein
MYIGQEDDCNATWEGVKSNGLVLPTLDGMATPAIQLAHNMSKSQMRQLLELLELFTLVFTR